MILRSPVNYLIIFLLKFVLSNDVLPKQEPTISECAAKGGECDENRGRPVCGTDDQTYPSRCHLLRVQCSGHQVSLKYRGPCKACKEAREYALKHKTKRPPKFIPRCKPDGTYAPIQCLGDTGCWCSDISGKPIENTSVRTGKPKCNEFNRANVRRSPTRHLSSHRSRRSCLQLDRATFSNNLIKVIHSEYIRSGQQYQRAISGVGSPYGGGSGERGVTRATVSDNVVLDWKFNFFDVNSNQILDKNEFRELKKLIKRLLKHTAAHKLYLKFFTQAVKPRRCGRAFGKFCDVNDDDRLSRNEWNNCITKDGINRHPGIDHESNGINNINNPASLGYGHQNTNQNTNNNNHQMLLTNRHELLTSLDDLESDSNSEDDESSQHLDYDDDPDYDPDEVEDDDEINVNYTFGSSTKFPTIHFLSPKPESPLKETEGDSDCLTDQSTALEEQRNGGTILYVPECMPDGRYQRVQCYRSTPYCWCVNEDTGKHIPGTSVKDTRPQCDSYYSQMRPMKGCPEPRKTEFLKNLKEFLKTQVMTNKISSANNTKWETEDERIATLNFMLFDKNKNKIWERKEWKIFRELMTNSKILRKCGKKFPRYCDVNTDKKITLSEWLSCLQTQTIELNAIKVNQSNESSVMKSTTKLCGSNPTKLCGSNPLEQYLKD